MPDDTLLCTARPGAGWGREQQLDPTWVWTTGPAAISWLCGFGHVPSAPAWESWLGGEDGLPALCGAVRLSAELFPEQELLTTGSEGSRGESTLCTH